MAILTRYDTAVSYSINDMDGGTVLTAVRRHGDIRVTVSTAPNAGDGAVYIGPNDAARLAEWLVQAACDARNSYTLDAPADDDDDDEGGIPADRSGRAMALAESWDRCPTCHMHITDTDDDGCETGSGQRWCVAHLIGAS
jgi:hypothetical protein